jgi:uncharacterized protein (TIGR02145 family)
MDVLRDLLSEIPGNAMCHVLTEAYSALFEDAASTATHKTKRVIRDLFPQLAGKWDDVAVDDRGNPILTMSGKQQTFIEYFERNIRNFFFHDGADQKFEPGVARIAYGELNMENRGQDSRRLAGLKKIVKLISDGHADEYDWNLNGMPYSELETRFGTAVQKADDDLKAKLSSAKYGVSDYVIKEIPDFKTAKAFYKYTNPDSRWCITHMENMWDSYTSDGMNKVYFAYKPDFKKADRIAGKNVPLDEYGLSLISIIVDPWENLRAVTTRWNHENGGSDQAMDARQLSELLGGNVFELCPPPLKPEQHIDRVDEDSVRIGDQIWMCHNLQMPADPEHGIYVENGETYFTWAAAMRVAKEYGNGWRLPSREDWNKLANYCGGDSKAGTHLKSTSGWDEENGFDTYGFDGKPVGYFFRVGGFARVCSVGISCSFWSSVPDRSTDAYCRCLISDYSNFLDSAYHKSYGYSVRLLRDSA